MSLGYEPPQALSPLPPPAPSPPAWQARALGTARLQLVEFSAFVEPPDAVDSVSETLGTDPGGGRGQEAVGAHVERSHSQARIPGQKQLSVSWRARPAGVFDSLGLMWTLSICVSLGSLDEGAAPHAESLEQRGIGKVTGHALGSSKERARRPCLG